MKKGKVKLTVSRGMTLNTGNYQSIRPQVEIEWYVGPDDDVTAEYDEKTDILEKLFGIETMSLYNEQKEFNRNPQDYCKSVINNI